ncbi:hypothetical protein thsps21_58500 [Pseudomonas sp. No.21]|jgi:hypothetical protein|uniref:DUF465 domain-containing protein n=1 Tax=Pseudomonas tohonis TaxID=2725477 RepID=A0A6J4DZP8_9PSED|nr:MULTISPECIES: DUF465 domain-containing protein [Pseudomonas]MDW3713731.1 DUF465 domain-containing protein [Pseudomonas sp. 2023EL-01195]PZE14895.1 hypothetical protein DMX10_02895 [Pseudomonas sp. 57B-090624]UXY53913.1 DUF465 domain-containing protein [Pseudomonas tohonis]BCG22930.1 hypothetical protein TUM18999_11210 [Pseudomonas tohonis]GJN49892.1 hypothetical protein TUM20249_58780 [Pseudomonas tohonis]
MTVYDTLPSTAPERDRKALYEARRAEERIARLREQYELLEKRIGRIEQGSEPLDGSSLQALRMRRDGLLQNLQALKAPERKEGCCGCGRACGG